MLALLFVSFARRVRRLPACGKQIRCDLSSFDSLLCARYAISIINYQLSIEKRARYAISIINYQLKNIFAVSFRLQADKSLPPHLLTRRERRPLSFPSTFCISPPCLHGLPARWRPVCCFLTFVTSFVGNGKFFASFGTACSKHSATVGGCHSLKEAVFVAAFAL